jgi:hypothetical protein
MSRIICLRGNMPDYVYAAGLSRAVESGDVAMAAVFLDNGVTARNLRDGMQQTVRTENEAMFNLLKDHGLDFRTVMPGVPVDPAFRQSLRYLEKNYECRQLRAELEAAKRELTAPAAAKAAEATAAPRRSAAGPALRGH